MENRYRLHNSAFDRTPKKEQVEAKRIYYISAEGNRTEPEYFRGVMDCREQLGIDAGILIVPLKRRGKDHLCLPSDVLELLEECVELRKAGETRVRDEVKGLLTDIKDIDSETIEAFLDDPTSVDRKAASEISGILNNYAYDLEYHRYLARLGGAESHDRFIVMFDRDADTHTEEQIRSCIKHCKEEGYLCLISNPLFELWLLMHFKDITKDYKDNFEEIKANAKVSNNHTFVSRELSEIAGHSKKNLHFEKNYLPRIHTAIENAKKLAGVQGIKDEEDLIDHIGTNMYVLFEDLMRKQ